MIEENRCAVVGGRNRMKGACSNCKAEDCWILHQVHHRNTYMRVCSSCVLKLNITSFCPICFSLHDRPKNSALPPLVLRGATLVCFKCNSSSHPSCVSPNTPKSPYLCPSCTHFSSSNNLFHFDFDFDFPHIDLRASKVLLAASLIASNSLSDALHQARLLAQRKAIDAVAARKRAKDTLHRVAHVWIRDQLLDRTTNTPIDSLGVGTKQDNIPT